MPLSISKLETLLSQKGFVPHKYFVMNDLCVYIEVISIKDVNKFLLYIPSKYKFIVKNVPNVFNIKYVNFTESKNNTADDYAGEPDEYNIENKYHEIDIDTNINKKDDNIEPNLELYYNREINIKDISDDDTKELRDIYRQLKRFKYCVKNVKYKIAIIYKNYLCSIKRDDEIEYYMIKNYKIKNTRQLYITTDLELFYEKNDILSDNMNTIQIGLYHILEKNQIVHTRTLNKLMEDKNDIMKVSENIYNKTKDYDKYIKEMEDMLVIINNSEKKYLKNIYESNEKYNDVTTTRLYNDIEKSHSNAHFEHELEKIQKIKEDIIKTLFDLKVKKENSILLIDQLMFDNNVMLEAIIRNFGKLSKLIS
jgi:hypothetical protein